MPKKYWKNLPEAELIPALIAGAQAREAAMVAAGAKPERTQPDTLPEIAQAITSCRDCPIAQCGTRAVMGEGPQNASLMIVGEQPGDQEDLAGRVFVGPAGQVLDEYLQAASIDRSAAYLTNAVKHFKFAWRGKHRLHQTPTAKEVDTCRWWLEAERTLVKPRLVLALGASAARSLLGRTVSVNRERGRAILLEDGAELWITAHPSYLLRLDGAAREEQTARFAADLAAVKARLAEIGT
jgi:uracil-DNA glycosylase